MKMEIQEAQDGTLHWISTSDTALVERVVVTNPIEVKQIANVQVKIDIRDTLILARLLAANPVREVWVPPVHVRECNKSWPGTGSWWVPIPRS